MLKKYKLNLSEFFETNDQMTEESILNIMTSIIIALEIVHNTGYVYNDLKLDNIMIDLHKNNDARVILIDYGMATRYLDKTTKKHFE